MLYEKIRTQTRESKSPRYGNKPTYEIPFNRKPVYGNKLRYVNKPG